MVTREMAQQGHRNRVEISTREARDVSLSLKEEELAVMEKEVSVEAVWHPSDTHPTGGIREARYGRDVRRGPISPVRIW